MHTNSTDGVSPGAPVPSPGAGVGTGAGLVSVIDYLSFLVFEVRPVERAATPTISLHRY